MGTNTSGDESGRASSVRSDVPRRARPYRDERGASAVEFALVLTLLVFFLFGTIQFGIAYNRYQGLQAASREGARVASIGGTKGEIRARVRATESMFDPLDVQVRIDHSADDGTTWATPICDDGTGNTCASTAAPTPCSEAGLGNLIRVTARVPAAGGKYAIVIPLWGNMEITYEAEGVFRCERIGG